MSMKQCMLYPADDLPCTQIRMWVCVIMYQMCLQETCVFISMTHWAGQQWLYFHSYWEGVFSLLARGCISITEQWMNLEMTCSRRKDGLKEQEGDSGCLSMHILPFSTATCMVLDLVRKSLQVVLIPHSKMSRQGLVQLVVLSWALLKILCIKSGGISIFVWCLVLSEGLILMDVTGHAQRIKINILTTQYLLKSRTLCFHIVFSHCVQL